MYSITTQDALAAIKELRTAKGFMDWFVEVDGMNLDDHTSMECLRGFLGLDSRPAK